MQATVKALIPMKVHSERVPNKNIRSLCGQPLFYWVIDALRQSERVSEIVVDTDSERIADEVRAHFDVRVLMRPARLWGDLVGINDLLEFELSEIDGDTFLQTHSCNPLLTTSTIDRAIESFFAHPENDSLFSVTPVQKRFYWLDGQPVNHDPDQLLRTQDLVPILEENSNLYIFSRESFARYRHRIGRQPFLFQMAALEAVDIDNEADFQIAEALMARRLAVPRMQL